jgi:2-(3-amino-3-carboxypropyl)histidine synthase
MIANPTVPAFRYDPYSKKFTRETYEHKEMKTIRGDAVKSARKGLKGGGAGNWAVTLGTLGRQGSLSVLKVCRRPRPCTFTDVQTIQSSLPAADNPPFMLLLSEMSPQKLALFSPEEITTFVQTSCPRLSIDWGYAFTRPLLSPYEASVAVGRVKGWGGLNLGSDANAKGEGDYPMDFYSDKSLGPWTPRHQPQKA